MEPIQEICKGCYKVKEQDEFKTCGKCREKNRKSYEKNKERDNERRMKHYYEHKEERQTKVHCDACNIDIQQNSWYKHLKSKEHLRNIGENVKKEFEDKLKYTKCPFCKWEVQTKHFKRHTQSGIHLANFKKTNL